MSFNTGSINTLLEKELIKITTKMVFRNPYMDKNFKNPRVPLTEEQNGIVKEFYNFLINKKESIY